MRFTAVILVHLSTFIVPAFTLFKTPPVPSRLKITSIGPINGESTLVCWQLSAPFVQSSQAGTAGAIFAQLGETGATSYLSLPRQSDGGFHNAPIVQCVLLVFLSLPVFTPHYLPPSTPSCFHSFFEVIKT